ncbi:MAG: hypothetical protein ACYCX9_08880 [Candidatus Dormibacteria bacterium]
MNTSHVLLLEGRSAEALAKLEPVLGTRTELGLGLSNGNVKSALVLATGAALDLGDLARAEELLGVVKSARLTARADDLRGDQSSVGAGFRVAEDGFRGLGAVFDLGVVLTEHTEWLVAHHHSDGAEAPRIEGKKIWEQLRASLWLERLDRLPTARSQTA